MSITASPADLIELLDYDPETGRLFWKTRISKYFNETPGRTAEHSCSIWNSKFSSKEAFLTTGSDGYLQGAVLGKIYRAHRVIWAMQTGQWPKDQIDHINNDPLDNRIENLREATHAQNMCNVKSRKGSSSKYLGVYLSKREQKWCAQINAHGRLKTLGYFSEEEDAAKAYDEAAKKFHGEFANPNFEQSTKIERVAS